MNVRTYQNGLNGGRMEKDTAQFAESIYSKTVLDKGKITLLNHMGGDLSVVAAARVSNGESYEEASHGTDKDARLINYLAKHRHGTPFEHSTFQFYVKAPLFVRSEWHRHRMASYNEISGRYVEYEAEFYIPDLIRVGGTTNKQGSVTPDQQWLNDWVAASPSISMWEDFETIEDWNAQMKLWMQLQCEAAFNMYQNFLKHGVAKEVARMILPANLYTQFYMTVNARGLMNFLSLRAAPDAQWEIQQYAYAMKDMFKDKMPLTYAAWEGNGFIAP